MKTREFLYAVVVAVGIAPLCASADVVPVGQSVAGQSQGQWTATWWQTMLAIPPAQNPILDPDGSFASGGDLGDVFLLAGTFGGTASRSVTIRDDQHLFFPLVNGLYINFDGSQTEADLRILVAEDIPFFNTLFANLDGAALVSDPFTQRIDSPPGLFTTVFPADNVFGIPPGSFDSVAAGYWIMLEPLAQGTHTLNFGGSSLGNPFVPDFSTDVTYTINVVPAPGATVALALGLASGLRRRRRI